MSDIVILASRILMSAVFIVYGSLNPLAPADRCSFLALVMGRLREQGGDVGDGVLGAVAGVVGIEVGVVSGVFNLESSGVDAPDWRPRHEEH
jgi:hypothetical protein